MTTSAPRYQGVYSHNRGDQASKNDSCITRFGNWVHFNIKLARFEKAEQPTVHVANLYLHRLQPSRIVAVQWGI